MTSISIEIENLSETESLGRTLGPHLFPGAVIALIGPLGAGKTHFVRAVAEGLEVRNPAAVNSPTFVLIQEDPARLPIYHFDAYRLKDWQAFQDLGTEEYFRGDGVCLVEWADRVETAMPVERLEIRIVPMDANRRRFEISAFGERYESLVNHWPGNKNFNTSP